MDIGRNDRVRIERAHVLAWPALRSVVVDGWLWRSSGGGSQRANSVSTIDFIGNDMETAIDDAEARYRAVGEPARFQTFDETSPLALADALRKRGYRPGGATLTMVLHRGTDVRPADVDYAVSASDEWLEVYLGAITESRRPVNTMILRNISSPSGFFSLRRNGRVVATALCVVGFGCAVIECVATRVDARRQGAARDLLAGVQSWAVAQKADLTGLQVAVENESAIGLYRQMGFRPAGLNYFWTCEPDQGRNGQDQTIRNVPAMATRNESGSPSRQ